jgi:hypothetical protein
MSSAAPSRSTSVADAPTIPVVDPAEDGSLVDDATEGRAFVVGLLAGGVVMSLLMFTLGLAAGLDVGVAAGVAPIPGVVAGLFFGMTAYLGVHLARHGH